MNGQLIGNIPVLGVTGLVWAQPIVDIISLVVGIGMYIKVSRKMMMKRC